MPRLSGAPEPRKLNAVGRLRGVALELVGAREPGLEGLVGSALATPNDHATELWARNSWAHRVASRGRCPGQDRYELIAADPRG